MEEEKKLKKQKNDFVSIYVCGSLVVWTIIGVIFTIINKVFMLPKMVDMGSLSEIFTSEFNLIFAIIFMIFQVIVVFFIYRFGISKFLTKYEVDSYEMLSKKAIKYTLIMCVTFTLIALFCVKEIVDDYNSIQKIYYLFEGFIETMVDSGDAANNIEEISAKSEEVTKYSNQLLKQITFYLIIVQVIVSGWIVFFNNSFFENRKNRVDEKI